MHQRYMWLIMYSSLPVPVLQFNTLEQNFTATLLRASPLLLLRDTELKGTADGGKERARTESRSHAQFPAHHLAEPSRQALEAGIRLECGQPRLRDNDGPFAACAKRGRRSPCHVNHLKIYVRYKAQTLRRVAGWPVSLSIPRTRR